jgi:transcriptional regulator with XRE-family HTH domain
MAKIKSTIKEAIATWNANHPELRKKTLSTIAEELGISVSALSQIEASSQFQKHLAVILESDVNFEQMTCFNIYKKIDIPVINKLSKIMELLECQIYDLVKRKD